MKKVRYRMVKPCDVKQGDRISGKMIGNVLSHKNYYPLVVVSVEEGRFGSFWAIWAVRVNEPFKEAVRLARYPHERVAVEVKQ